MSAFGNELGRLMAARNITGLGLAEITGLSDGHISKLRKGVQTWVSPEDMEKILTSITDDPLERAQLIRAHLLDECHGPGSELIEIQVKSRRSQDKPSTIDLDRLPLDYRHAIEALVAEGPHDKDLRDLVLSLTKMVAPEATARPPARSASRKGPALPANSSAAADVVEAADLDPELAGTPYPKSGRSRKAAVPSGDKPLPSAGVSPRSKSRPLPLKSVPT